MSRERADHEDDKLWKSVNPNHGTVRAVVTEDGYAAVLDDLNSDYREVVLTFWRRNRRHWDNFYEADDAGFPELNDWLGGEVIPGLICVVGRARPGRTVTVSVLNQANEVRADAQGWWLFVRPVETPEGWAGSPVYVTC